MLGTHHHAVKIIVFTLSVGILSMAAASVAGAGDRFTPYSLVADDEHVICLVANVTKVTRTVIIEIRDGGGSPVTQDCIDDNPVSLSVGAGDVKFHSCSSAGARYCRFTVVGAASSAIRAVMEIRKSNLDKVLVVPAQ